MATLGDIRERLNRPSALPLGVAVGAQMAGIPVISTLTPPVYHSLYTGIITSAGLIHRGGLHFSGAWGYRTLFSGRVTGWSRFTLGHATLSAIESIGQRAWEKGYRNVFTAWAKNARELGLAGYFGRGKSILQGAEITPLAGNKGAILNSLRPNFWEVTEDIIKLEKDPKFFRFVGGLGEDVSKWIRVPYKKGDEVVEHIFPKFSAEGGFLLKGTKWAFTGTLLTAYSWFELANMAATPLINYALQRATNAAGLIKQFLAEQRQFQMDVDIWVPVFKTTMLQPSGSVLFRLSMQPG